MIYNVGFRINGEVQEYDGLKYICFTGDYIAILRELLGKYPSSFDCYPVEKFLPYLEKAMKKIDEIDPQHPALRSGKTLDAARVILEAMHERCIAFPDAKLEVDW